MAFFSITVDANEWRKMQSNLLDLREFVSALPCANYEFSDCKTEKRNENNYCRPCREKSWKQFQDEAFSVPLD